MKRLLIFVLIFIFIGCDSEKEIKVSYVVSPEGITWAAEGDVQSDEIWGDFESTTLYGSVDSTTWVAIDTILWDSTIFFNVPGNTYRWYQGEWVGGGVMTIQGIYYNWCDSAITE